MADEFTPEELNFFRICHVSHHVIPDGLRHVFKKEWDACYRSSHGEWNNTASNGADFYSLTTPGEKKAKIKELAIIRNGNSLEWDCTRLIYAIIYSNCFKKSLNSMVRDAVEDLRVFRNKFAHTPNTKVTDTDFQASMQKVINAFNDLNLDVTAIEKIKTQVSFPTDELREIEKQLEKEKKYNEEPQTFCDLPPKPSHVGIERHSEVNSIMNEMKTLRCRHPNEGTYVYLSGNPGCGKSETARQIGEKFFLDTTSLTFVATLNASSVDALLRSYIDFARQLNVNEDYIQNIVSCQAFALLEDKILQLMALVKRKIEMFSSWLVIVDNVVDLKEASKFFPSVKQSKDGKGQILVTTQDTQSIPLTNLNIHHVSLSNGMNPDDAVSTLCIISEQSKDKDVALKVAKALDFQPLALVCAAFYMKLVNTYGSLNWNECLSLIQKGRREVTEKPYLDSSGQTYSESMTTAVKMAVHRVIEKDKIMMFAFQFLSVVAQDPIPMKCVVQYVLKCMPDEEEGSIAAHIASSSLVLTSEYFQDIRVHQIVHNVVQEALRHEVENNCLTLANVIESFSSFNVKDDEEPDCDFIMATRSLVPHFLSLQKIIQPDHFCAFDHYAMKGAHYKLLNYFIYYYHQFFARSKQLTKEQSLEVAKCLSRSIGTICAINGHYEAARACYETSLSIQKTFCAKTNNGFSAELIKLGEVLYHLGACEKAKTCFEQALADANDSGFKLRALTSLAKVLWELGQEDEALKRLENARQCIGNIEESPLKARILTNMAVVYLSVEELTDVKPETKRAFTTDGRRIVNPYMVFCGISDPSAWLQDMLQEEYFQNLFIEHPHLENQLANFGTAIFYQFRYIKATECSEKALAIDESIYGKNHPSVAIDLNSLGMVQKAKRQYEEARKSMERAVAIDESIYGDKHPNLAIHLNSLGSVLQGLREFEKARKCMERAVAIDESIYSDKHPNLAIHLNSLGSVLQDLREFEKARKCMERAVAIDESIYGDKHPNLVIPLFNLSSVLQDLAQPNEARKCEERAIAIGKCAFDKNRSPQKILMTHEDHLKKENEREVLHFFVSCILKIIIVIIIFSFLCFTGLLKHIIAAGILMTANDYFRRVNHNVRQQNTTSSLEFPLIMLVLCSCYFLGDYTLFYIYISYFYLR